MKRRRVILAGGALAVVGFLLLGGQVPGCLGPLGVTLAQCAKAMADRGHPFAPGPGAGTALMVALPLAVFLATLMPWQRLSRSRLLASGIAAAIAGAVGALYYDMTRPTSITQTNHVSGLTHTAPLAANADLRILTGLFAASVVGIGATWLLAFVSARNQQ